MRVRQRKVRDRTDGLGLTLAEELEARVGRPCPVRGSVFATAAERRRAEQRIAEVDADYSKLILMIIRGALQYAEPAGPGHDGWHARAEQRLQGARAYRAEGVRPSERA